MRGQRNVRRDGEENVSYPPRKKCGPWRGRGAALLPSSQSEVAISVFWGRKWCLSFAVILSCTSSSPLPKCKNFFGKTVIRLIHFCLGAFGREGEGQSQKGEDRSPAVWP